LARPSSKKPAVAKLLVSVRSVIEAREAVAAGAAIVDIKEPRRGSLGRADDKVWAEVLGAVPHRVPVSVALGELNEWFAPDPPAFAPWPPASVAFVKLGLSQARPDWRARWRTLRGQIAQVAVPIPAWVAVIYTDWQRAGAPSPDEVLSEALEISECRGVLFDTWDKSVDSAIDSSWTKRADRIRSRGRFLALAGRLDARAIARLAYLQPEIIAVRSAACVGGDRQASVDRARVSDLARAALWLGSGRLAAEFVSVGPQDATEQAVRLKNS
jgi:uncharacterized protein (UPF0264 family)